MMKKKPNLLIVSLISFFIMVEVMILRPTTTEINEEASVGMFSSIETMVLAQKKDDEVGYTILGYHYTAVEGEQKNWEIMATEAILYEKSRLVSAKDAKIKMFDSTGKVTLIEGNKAYYKMGSKDLELVGNVMVTFPDGFWVKTNRAFYIGAQEKIFTKEEFNGEAIPKSDKKSNQQEIMQMSGVGFDTTKTGPEVFIHQKAHVQIKRIQNNEITDVKSDYARIDRNKKFGYFWMQALDRFVESYQGTLFVRSRKQDATYDSATSSVKYMTAYDDVRIEETDKKKKKGGLQYATAQKADFMTAEDKILLSGFPSAYQEHDTLTGELIVIFRKKNIVEVTQSNAYHESTSEENQEANEETKEP